MKKKILYKHVWKKVRLEPSISMLITLSHVTTPICSLRWYNPNPTTEVGRNAVLTLCCSCPKEPFSPPVSAIGWLSIIVELQFIYKVSFSA